MYIHQVETSGTDTATDITGGNISVIHLSIWALPSHDDFFNYFLAVSPPSELLIPLGTGYIFVSLSAASLKSLSISIN